MLPGNLQALFWDIDHTDFNPVAFPDYTIFRILEYGNDDAVAWMRATFPEGEVRRVLRAERRLSRKSANFWALIYGMPRREVAAFAEDC